MQNASPPPIQSSPIVKSSPSTNVTKSQLRVMKQKRQQFRRPDDRGSNGSSRGASSGLITNTFSYRIFSFEYSSIFTRLGFSSGHSSWRILMLSKVNLVMKSPVSPPVAKIDRNMRDAFVVNIPKQS